MKNFNEANKIINDAYKIIHDLNGTILFQERNVGRKHETIHNVQRPNNYGLISDSKKLFYILIPKCASSSLGSSLEGKMENIDFEKDYHKFTEENDYRGFAVLREPLERWISGACTFIDSYSGKLDREGPLNIDLEKDRSNLDKVLHNVFVQHSIMEFLISHLITDIHGLTQSWFLYPSDAKKIDFFYMNDNLGSQLNRYLTSMGIVNFLDNNKNNSTHPSNTLYKFLNEFLSNSSNEKYKNKILKFLKPDYDLINTVTFYNR